MNLAQNNVINFSMLLLLLASIVLVNIHWTGTALTA